MGKYLEALKILYVEDEKVCEAPGGGNDKTDESTPDTPFVSNVSTWSGHLENFQVLEEQGSIPFTEHEIAEHEIDGLKLHDDRVFVRRQLIGAYGKKRLELVNQYFDHWQKGMDAQPEEIKKENAGRKRANTFLRTLKKKGI